MWVIDPKDLEAVKNRKVGRPRKAGKTSKRKKADSTLVFIETAEKRSLRPFRPCLKKVNQAFERGS